jgi:lipopolysaccharide/colanic/teichoic acid biosynthesis glycosyltransferase
MQTAPSQAQPLHSVAAAIPVHPVEPPAGAGVAAPPHRFYRGGLKRALDLTLVVITAPLWLAIIAIAACLVALDGHNPFYTQERIGRGGRVFRLFKLRSMVHDADAALEAHLAANPEARAEWASSQKLKCDPRITPVGKVIRKISIDELPQLINVLLGDMSLVGPRPIMVNQKALYPGDRYYRMRPGLTGFWQISDRNECRFVDRVRFDNAYYWAVSFKTDLIVLWRTVGVVLRGTGY